MPHVRCETRIVVDASCTIYDALVKSLLASSAIGLDLVVAVHCVAADVANLHPGKLLAPARVDRGHELNANDDHDEILLRIARNASRTAQNAVHTINPAENTMLPRAAANIMIKLQSKM